MRSYFKYLIVFFVFLSSPFSEAMECELNYRSLGISALADARGLKVAERNRMIRIMEIAYGLLQGVPSISLPWAEDAVLFRQSDIIPDFSKTLFSSNSSLLDGVQVLASEIEKVPARSGHLMLSRSFKALREMYSSVKYVEVIDNSIIVGASTETQGAVTLGDSLGVDISRLPDANSVDIEPLKASYGVLAPGVLPWENRIGFIRFKVRGGTPVAVFEFNPEYVGSVTREMIQQAIDSDPYLSLIGNPPPQQISFP